MTGPMRERLTNAYIHLLKQRAARRSGPTLWIISGPSSAGKTTFLRSPRCAELTGLQAETPVVRMGRARDRLPLILKRDVFLHYNILRPGLWGMNQGLGPTDLLDFRSNDREWRLVASLPIAKRAIVLVADAETLVSRVRQRTTREKWSDQPYPREKFLDAFESTEPAALYEAWRAELSASGIPFVEVDATTHEVLGRWPDEPSSRPAAGLS